MPSLGDIIDGRFRLVRLLGRGGMGEVYEAEHVEIGAKAAIKFLRPEAGSDATALLRFKREARAAGAIGHDAIISVQDLGMTDDGSLFLVMELLRGHSLGERLGFADQLDPELTAYVGCQVLSGLAAAHRAGIIHRDLKTENIFLVESGAPLPGVKILDFGISQVTDAAESQGGLRLTQTGMVVGTPAYMSPEQARGGTFDERSDLFAVGVILYECLSGHSPFDRRNYNATVAAILTEEVEPLRSRCPEIPEALEAAVLWALSKSPADRPPSAAAMLLDLLPFVEERAVGRIPLPEELVQQGLLPLPSNDAPGSSGADTRRGPSTGLWWESDSKNQRRVATRPTLALILGGLALLGVVAIGAVVLLFWNAADVEAEAVAPRPAAAPPPAPEPTPPPVIAPQPVAVVELEGLPEGATVALDGALVDELPLRLARGADPIELRVEAEGFEPLVMTITPDEDQRLTVEMTREAPQRRRRRWRRRRTSRPERQRPDYLVPAHVPEYLED